ncbi:MAG: class I SAM-dependent methyltransferase [Actinobacteria bacterium]|nr:class I SAM-dependent methyltransferase [Actinomycetota bacterium]
MNEDFYRVFEARYRGSRESIMSRLRAYLPFVEPLRGFYDTPKAVDLGCGRGEWLELMLEAKFMPYGVDLDDGMLGACVELGLPAEKGDAVAYLATLPDESQAVVSAFHVVEHIGFEQLRLLVSEALRVLKPGGLLIMETPNPENIVVATRDFYVDPTHRRPIPPLLLSFLPEHYGFERVKILRLQESAELACNKAPSLLDVLSGVSPDYAVVAQKAGSEEIIAATKPAFDAEYGLTLESLAGRYDQHAEARATEAEARAVDLINSTSWRITAPMRRMVSILRRLVSP